MGVRMPVIVILRSVMIVILHGLGETRSFIGQRKQGVAFGAAKLAAALFARKKRDETAGKQKTEEQGDWYDGHAWNVWKEYRQNRLP